MTMESFQRAMCDLVASPDLCRLMLDDPEPVLARYDLTERERLRLREVVRQRGMSVNCTLYRANRITPIYTLMPRTCFLLGDDLISEAELFWGSFQETQLRFKQEIELFGEFLRERIESGQLVRPFLADALEFDLAVNQLSYLPRQSILDGLDRAGLEDANGTWRLHPLTKLVLFRHEPTTLLRLLSEQKPLPYKVAAGEFWLILDVFNGELQAKLADPQLGRLLRAIEDGSAPALSPDAAEALIEAGLIVHSPTTHITA